MAAANGFYDVAAFLLRCGVSPAVRDYDLWMPVHASANWNHPDVIELLCEYGSEINAKTNTGETPFGANIVLFLPHLFIVFRIG